MTLAIIASAILGLALFTVVLTLLGGAIRRSHADVRLALVARRPARDARRSSAQPYTGWAARPDAS